MTTPEQMDQMQAGPWGYASSDISALIAELRAKSERQLLPARRRNETVETYWNGHGFTVCIGFDAIGRPAEVFCDHAKGDMRATLADACVLISLGLQHGISPAAMSKSLGTVPAWVNGDKIDAPASPVGAILAVVRDIATQVGGGE